MAIAHSRVTSQNQISVPSEIRKRLGLGPGSVLEWHDAGDEVVVRKSGRHTSEEIHRALFSADEEVKPKVSVEVAIREHIRRRHARG